MARYKILGDLISAGRRKAGLRQQSDLADRLGCSQQAVSRWEAGLSRPKPEQLPALSAQIGIEEDALRQAGGYGAGSEVLPATVTVSYDQPLPTDALSPSAFENFTVELLHGLYSDAREIRLAGKTGHDQGGIDVLVIQKDGRQLTFQCKRVTRFGPADVAKAVEEHTEAADGKYLVLSRVASPQTAAAVRNHSGWTLWDRNDLSRLFRTKLEPHEQKRLINMFFPNQGSALLGTVASGSWQRPEEFFAAFAGRSATFTHDWALVGRQGDADKIVQHLLDGRNRMLLVTGSGGTGKTRIVKRAIEQLRERAPYLTCLFLSPTESVNAKVLDELSPGPKVLVVDDAHDRSDLSALFGYAANQAHDVRLLTATRPYARERLRAQAGTMAFAGVIDEIDLAPLNLEETTELASEVLKRFEGNPDLAEPIARATLGTPLVTVMAARIAAVEKLPPIMAQGQQEFRDTILGKFEKVLSGQIAGPSDQKRVSDMLQVIALVQPFSIEDKEFRELVTAVTGADDNAVSITLRALSEGGVIFRRGGQYRLQPDLLGDFIIDRSCIGGDERLTSLAERVFHDAPRNLLSNVLVNLGRLDWRRNSQDVSKSHLLDHLWQALRLTSEHHNSAIEAAAAAAFYQPHHALDFVAAQVRKGANTEGLTKILRNTAYHIEYVTDVCTLLWKMGRNDGRDTGPHPHHPIRILKELCEVEPDKPVSFNRKVVEFGISLLSSPQSFDGPYTPFDFLQGILAGEGHTTSTSNNNTLVMKAFQVNYDAVEKLRGMVIDAAIDILCQPRERIAVMAAEFLQNALRYPMSIMGLRIGDETIDKYTIEFSATLKRIKDLMVAGKFSPVVSIAIANAVSWHADYANPMTGKIAKAILKALPDTLEFRVLSALADGFGRIFLGRMDSNTWQARLNKWMSDNADALSGHHSDASALRLYLEEGLEKIIHSGLAKEDSTHTFIFEMLRKRLDLAQEVVETALDNADARMTVYLGNALWFYQNDNHDAGVTWARRLLDTGNPRLQSAVAQAFNSPAIPNGEIAADDFDIAVRVLGSEHRNVVLTALGLLHSLSQKAPRLALDMLRHVNFQHDHHVIDRTFMMFHGDASIMFAHMTEDDARFVLSQLTPVVELTGHWVETLLSHLSYHYPELTIRFFLKRVEMAATEEKFYGMRPINYGPWVHVALRFRESDRFRSALEEVWTWMVGHPGTGDWRFEYNAAAVFDAMFLPVDGTVIDFLSGKMDLADKNALRWIANVLSHGDATVVFSNVDFVVHYLDVCERAGEKVYENGLHQLFRSAISGVRSGIAGEPFPRDIEYTKQASEVLERLPRMSAAYELYRMIRDDAERNIERARSDAEYFRS